MGTWRENKAIALSTYLEWSRELGWWSYLHIGTDVNESRATRRIVSNPRRCTDEPRGGERESCADKHRRRREDPLIRLSRSSSEILIVVSVDDANRSAPYPLRWKATFSWNNCFNKNNRTRCCPFDRSSSDERPKQDPRWWPSLSRPDDIRSYLLHRSLDTIFLCIDKTLQNNLDGHIDIIILVDEVSEMDASVCFGDTNHWFDLSNRHGNTASDQRLTSLLRVELSNLLLIDRSHSSMDSFVRVDRIFLEEFLRNQFDVEDIRNDLNRHRSSLITAEREIVTWLCCVPHRFHWPKDDDACDSAWRNESSVHRRTSASMCNTVRHLNWIVDVSRSTENIETSQDWFGEIQFIGRFVIPVNDTISARSWEREDLLFEIIAEDIFTRFVTRLDVERQRSSSYRRPRLVRFSCVKDRPERREKRK